MSREKEEQPLKEADGGAAAVGVSSPPGKSSGPQTTLSIIWSRRAWLKGALFIMPHHSIATATASRSTTRPEKRARTPLLPASDARPGGSLAAVLHVASLRCLLLALLQGRHFFVFSRRSQSVTDKYFGTTTSRENICRIHRRRFPLSF